jgi:site-specific recombinase XerD
MKGWTYFHRNLHMHGVRMHRFRHWFGTMIQRLYKDILVTQRLLGHASPATTAGYVLVAAEQTRAAVDLLPRFDAVAFAA